MGQAASSHEQHGSVLSNSHQTYFLFGHILASDFVFANRMMRREGAPDLTFTCLDHSPYAVDSNASVFLHTAPVNAGDIEGVGLLRRSDACDVLSFERVADFYVWPDRIICHLMDPSYQYMVEIWLLGTVMSFWLEKRGILALHAAAAVVDGRATAFLSSNSGGKSSLIASLMQVGYPLLTDDVLAIGRQGDVFVGLPGYPQMRFWPNEARYFLGHSDDLEIVHPAYSKRRVSVGQRGFGTFCDSEQPLACLYLPERHPVGRNRTEIEITAVSPRDAVIELARHSFVGSILDRERQAERLELFSQLVPEVPIRRIAYPAGLEELPRVRDAILQDLRGAQVG